MRPTMASLSARLLLAVSLLLVVFFGATIVVLDLVFANAAERAIRDRLDVQLIVLLAVPFETTRWGGAIEWSATGHTVCGPWFGPCVSAV